MRVQTAVMFPSLCLWQKKKKKMFAKDIFILLPHKLLLCSAKGNFPILQEERKSLCSRTQTHGPSNSLLVPAKEVLL